MKKLLVTVLAITAMGMIQRLGYADVFSKFRLGSVATSAVSASAKDNLRDSVKDIYKSPCNVAYVAYNNVKNQYDAKRAVCNEMDAAESNRNKYATIASAVGTVRWDAPGGSTGDCGNYIGAKRDEYSTLRDQASNLFWEKWDKCHFDGPSISALSSSLSAAESGVCSACNNEWPGPADPADPSHGSVERHCVGPSTP